MTSSTDGSYGPATPHFEALLARIRDGDESAREEILRDIYWRARRLTRFIIHGKFHKNLGLETGDLLGEAYLKFITTYRNGLQQDFENLPQLLGYLYKIIKTTALDQVRKLMGKQFKAQFPKGELPPDIPEDVRKRLSFQVLVDELPRDGQQVVELKFEWLCTEAEIGQLLGISRHMVRETYSRAMIRLKKDFDDPGKKDSVLHVANEEI